MEKMKKIVIFLLFIITVVVYGSEITPYFSPQDKLDQRILEKLKEAKKSIYIVSYTFNWEQANKILNLLADRGVKIKILLQFPPEYFFNKSKNIDVKKWTKSSCAMHAKFIVIDTENVIVGSANFSQSSLIWDSNNILFIRDKKIAEFFENNFFSLWSGRTNLTSYSASDISIYFSPSTDCISLIANEIKNAKKTIKFTIFSFTSDIISEEICRAGMKGINIYGIFEGSQNPFSNEYSFLKRFKFFNIKKDCFVENIHDKTMIIDDATVLTGSFNYSESARKNVETFIVLKQPESVNLYVRRFRYLWIWY